MSRSDRATVLRINSVGAVGAQVAPGRVMFEHRAEDHEQRAHAGGERANTRVGQAASTDVGTTGREMLGAHSQHRFRRPHARPSQRLAPFPSFRHSHPSAIPILPPFLRPLRHSCAPPVIPAEAGIHATAQPCDEPPSATPFLPPFPSFRHSCAPSVIPAEAGIHATAQPCDEPPSAIPILPPFLRPLRHSCGGRNPRDRPTVRRASIRHSHPSVIPAPPPSFLRRQESMRPPNRATSLHPPFPSFRHSCAPSVIPAEAGIHATAQPCDEPPSAIPILPPFLRPLRHSCGGRNPRDRPTVRRASIRPTAHQSPQRAAGDRAPSNIGCALDPTDRMDSCLRRNDGQGRV